MCAVPRMSPEKCYATKFERLRCNSPEVAFKESGRFHATSLNFGGCAQDVSFVCTLLFPNDPFDTLLCFLSTSDRKAGSDFSETSETSHHGTQLGQNVFQLALRSRWPATE